MGGRASDEMGGASGEEDTTLLARHSHEQRDGS